MEAFLAVADELHFGRAARRLHLSQARVSQTIQRLERRIGSPLFDRTTRRVSLTPIGRRLLDELRPAHQAVLDALGRAQAAGRGIAGVLRVAFLGPVAGRVVLEVMTTVRADHPDLDIQLCETQIADPCRPLRDEEVDLVLTQLPVNEPGITTGPVVVSEPRVLAVSTRHPYARRESVSLEDLSRDCTFRPAGNPSPDWLDSYLPWSTPAGRPIERGPAVATFQELLALIAAGQGICPVAAHNSRYHPRPDITFVPLADAPPFEFGLAWRTSAQTTRVKIFIKTTDKLVTAWGGPTAAAQRL
ncbi:LysR family transcriptional regulator [Nonomuraea sp. KC401]|nr:LysR family transcriptional regulator [Nonomuraea sp. K271]TLF81881.1 LysR family transcriptional regulator [Nonomuraea sp. KC401]